MELTSIKRRSAADEVHDQLLKQLVAGAQPPGSRLPSERKLAEVSKRFARLFFRSELHEKIAGTSDETKVMRFPEQALYHMFARNEDYIMKQMEATIGQLYPAIILARLVSIEVSQRDQKPRSKHGQKVAQDPGGAAGDR